MVQRPSPSVPLTVAGSLSSTSISLSTSKPGLSQRTCDERNAVVVVCAGGAVAVGKRAAESGGLRGRRARGAAHVVVHRGHDLVGNLVAAGLRRVTVRLAELELPLALDLRGGLGGGQRSASDSAARMRAGAQGGAPAGALRGGESAHERWADAPAAENRAPGASRAAGRLASIRLTCQWRQWMGRSACAAHTQRARAARMLLGSPMTAWPAASCAAPSPPGAARAAGACGRCVRQSALLRAEPRLALQTPPARLRGSSLPACIRALSAALGRGEAHHHLFSTRWLRSRGS